MLKILTIIIDKRNSIISLISLVSPIVPHSLLQVWKLVHGSSCLEPQQLIPAPIIVIKQQQNGVFAGQHLHVSL